MTRWLMRYVCDGNVHELVLEGVTPEDAWDTYWRTAEVIDLCGGTGFRVLSSEHVVDPEIHVAQAMTTYLKAIAASQNVIEARQELMEAIEALEQNSRTETLLEIASLMDEVYLELNDKKSE